ncbi:MAG: lysine--tRNA ligase [Dehalococcoidales bacterium]|nr:lysine--tRNA ligase [Dehalococcoidales bacterium]
MASRLERISQDRLDKVTRLREAGVDPYPNKYPRTHTAQQAKELLEKIEAGEATGDRIMVAGRIMANRSMGKSSFMDIRDGTDKLQLLFMNVKQMEEPKLQQFKDLDIGDFIGVEGSILRTRTGEPTVRVDKYVLLSKSLLPLPDKFHGVSDIEVRYRQRYVDLISNPEVKELFKIRSRIISAIRRFLDDRDFIEVETPVLHPSAGGALATPFITHHNALDQDFYMRIALELHLKRLIVGGFDKVYEIGRIFRNEGISTTHNPEFTLIETYEAYADYHDVMKMQEDLIAQAARDVLGTEIITFNGNEINLAPPWQRVPLRDAVKEYSGIDFVKYPTAAELMEKMRSMDMEVDPNKNWAKQVDEIYKTYARPKIIQPTILYDYPVSLSPLAKNKPGEERVVERFQSVIAGLEVDNAYSELNDPVLQRKRFEEQLKDRIESDEERWTIDEDYLTALEYGMPPTGGLGIGIDRLVMLLTDKQSIREVILFPQLRDKE